MCCMRLAGNTGRKNYAKIAICAPSHNFVGLYLHNEGTYRQSEKNWLSSNISSTCPHNMVNFSPLAAEIVSLVWGTPANVNGVSRLGGVTARHSSIGRQPNFAVLNRGRHLYSAGRPSRWALAHILVVYFLVPCGGLSWLFVSFWVQINVVYRIVSYRISKCTNCWYLLSYSKHNAIFHALYCNTGRGSVRIPSGILMFKRIGLRVTCVC